jgi:hypothetical protein
MLVSSDETDHQTGLVPKAAHEQSSRSRHDPVGQENWLSGQPLLSVSTLHF